MRAALVTFAAALLGWGVAEARDDRPARGAPPPLVLTLAELPAERPPYLEVAMTLDPEVPPRPRLDLVAPGVGLPGPEPGRRPLDFSAPAPARPSRWDRGDLALQSLVGVGLLVDYLQTRQIVRDGSEGNPVIGRHGARLRPGLYFPIVFGVSTAAAHALPREWRRTLQGALIGTQGVTVYRNWVNSGRNPFRP